MHDSSLRWLQAVISPEVQVQCALPRKERLARKEKILNRQSESRNKMKQYDPVSAPAAATKSITNSSKEEKVLEKGEQMKKFKKLGCAKW